MLRNGSDGNWRDGGIGAKGFVGADDSAASGAPAELLTADLTPSAEAGAEHNPHPVTPSHSGGGLASPHPSGSLSLSRLSAGALAGLGRDELLGVLGDVERLANRLDGYRAEVLGALNVLNQSGVAPDASPHLSLRDAAGVSERDARRMLRAAEKAREHHAVLEALSDGDINTAQAETLCDARVPEPVRAELVAAAAGEDTDATRLRVRRAEAEHSVETSMQRFERQRAARGAGWRRDHEGMLGLWAKFDPDTGAHIEAALEALRREYWAEDKQVRTSRRTPAQRDADVLAYALAGLTHCDADAAAVGRLHARARDRSDNLPDDSPPSKRTTPHKNAPKRATAECERPHSDAPEANDEGPAYERQLPPAQISVLIGLDALRGHTDEMGLTDAGVELPPEVVRRLACDAEIIPMVLDGPGGPADVGRSRRTVPLRLRRLLVARDRHCRWPGCAEPASRCDAHHIWHWIDGGPTNLNNLVLLCHRHHHYLHQHGYKMVPQPDRTWTTAKQAEHNPTPSTRQSPQQPRGP